MRQLNSQGMLTYEGRRYFVCEALAGELVGTKAFDGKLYVTYRDLLVREIDLATGKTRAPVD